MPFSLVDPQGVHGGYANAPGLGIITSKSGYNIRVTESNLHSRLSAQQPFLPSPTFLSFKQGALLKEATVCYNEEINISFYTKG